MSRLRALKKRPDSEHEQACIRIIIVAIVLIYFLISSALKPHIASQSISYGLYWLLFYALCAGLIFAHIVFKPAINPRRRLLAIIGDMSSISMMLYFTDEFGTVFFTLYLWVSIGYGLRFGQTYLYVAMLGAVAGFSLVLYFSVFWLQHLSIGIGLLIGLIALPLYFSILLSRLAKTNAQLNAMLEKTAHLATYDTLTELPNRYLFFDRLKQALHVAQQQHESLALLFLDLDGFKAINDNLGHKTGDSLLRAVAARLRHKVRQSDLVARLGGDEFVVLLTNVDKQISIAVAENLLESLAQPLRIGTYYHKITTSIGIALFPEAGIEADTLMNHADMAMYHAKQRGKNCYVVYTSETLYRVTAEINPAQLAENLAEMERS